MVHHKVIWKGNKNPKGKKPHFLQNTPWSRYSSYKQDLTSAMG